MIVNIGTVRLGTGHDVSDAQSLAAIVLDPTGAGLDAALLARTRLLAALILHVCYAPDDTERPLRLMRVSGASDAAAPRELLLEVRNTSFRHPKLLAEWNETIVRPYIIEAIDAVLALGDRELAACMTFIREQVASCVPWGSKNGFSLN
jgi:hypothetical protein